MEAGRLGVMELGFPGPLRDLLVAAVLDGTKTTTTGLLADYEREGEPLPRPGDRDVVIDSAGEPVGVIETLAVRVVRVGDVDLAHAIGEGEGYESVAEWRAGHEEFWHSAEMREALGDPAFTVDDDTEAVAIEFRLLPGDGLDLPGLLSEARLGKQPQGAVVTVSSPAPSASSSGTLPSSPGSAPSALIPSSVRSLPLAVAAKGARIFDEAGLDYIDASSGPLAVTLGHAHPRVLAAIADQFSAVDYVHRTQFRNGAAERLAELVTERLGGGLGHVMFVSSGSEANEIAMKFAHLYWASQGRHDKHRFVSSSVSYHGNTAGALGASGQPRYAAPYRPLVHAGETITAPQVYRLPVPDGSTAAQVCIARLREEFARLDLRRTAAVLLEGVGGSGSGVLVPPPGFLEELRRLCDASDVLWISDEVMSGFGRTGAWFAFQHSAAVPDIVTFAKGAGGGSLPLGGAALSGKVWNQIRGVYPAMSAGHTFTNGPLACAAGIATIETLEEERLVERVARRGAQLGEELRALQAEFPFLGDVRGAGYLWGLEFVADPATAAPPDPALDITAKAIAAAAASRLIVYPARFCVDGTRGDAILIGPPLTATDEELHELIVRLRATLTALSPLFA
ncbi:aminotransferase class III-fold pyridoxal phosphate-dependent enzyme [Trebonia kvetii]|uniref:Aminotransferase class III-fold pyridoxal phosphate-dependent enzyme n=1 Tax=Trebonia kvetii TaxID=2480626 RepID=A0A6P2C6P5_9ACTN|nr:aminotransferase class III-fold pyridoxal phosphate-dependent enzyme [Trebonia kvetii]TVZ05741.1 aminotransferase class III-fold pyridoxal phosphate-dependent enzyme [Trebonia kvetii]